MKKPWNIFICILINLECSGEIAVTDNETFHDESNVTFYDELSKSSENLTTFGYEISNFSDKYVEVRNTRGPTFDPVHN